MPSSADPPATRDPRPDPAEIFLVRGGAIGDFILTLPVLSALRRRFPAARRTLMARPFILPLAEAGGLADLRCSIESRGLASFLVEGGDLDRDLAALLARADLIVSYLHDPEGRFRANVARVSAARFLAGPHRPDEAAARHATARLLEPLQALGIAEADPVPRLRLAAGVPAASGPPLLALHPGSGSVRKNWPEERWAELLLRLVGETAMRLLLVGGEAEGDRVYRLAAPLPRERVEVAQGLPLGELARRLAGCAGFVGHDSGITHLAAALGLPCLALWGETRAAVWRPQGEGTTLLSDPRGLAALGVERVRGALGPMLGEGDRSG